MFKCLSIAAKRLCAAVRISNPNPKIKTTCKFKELVNFIEEKLSGQYR